MLKPNLPAINDQAGSFVPQGFPPVIDAHVHIFPGDIFAAIRHWFDQNAWPIRYRMTSTQLLEKLLSWGVSHIVALQYAHKPGIARMLNRYMAKQCALFPGQVTGMATVFPGEPEAAKILQDAFELGLGGVKLHAHVQCFDMDSLEMEVIYQTCLAACKPLVMHVGREPKSEAYRCDPYLLCRADKLEQVVRTYPDLRICVPHLGFDENETYRSLIETYDNLWLDTTMVLTDYFPIDPPVDLIRYRDDRVMYGSDFPNIPYAWDRELKWLRDAGLHADVLEQILYRNAKTFFSL